jgi:hypothetical protein
MTQKGTMRGFIRAVADTKHPLQTRLSLILTDFEPNGNKQGIPLAERDNIIATALHQPLKINFTGDGYTGHTGAIPIGPITAAYAGIDNGRDVIMGDAVIWNEVYNDIAEHLKVAFSEGVGTSWEIYFEDAETDTNGVNWLHGCVFAGTCVVEVPAYGPNRTRVLAIAEALEAKEDTLTEVENNMAVDQKVESAADTTNMDETRNQLLETQDLLFKLWEGVDTLFNKTFEIEAASVEKDIGTIAAQFAEKISKIAEKLDKLSVASAQAEQLAVEVEELKTERDNRAKAERINERKAKLAEAGIEISPEDTARLDRYMSMEDELFTALVEDIKVVSAKRSATAEQKTVVIPEPNGNGTELTTEELVQALRKEFSTRK